MFLKLLLAKTLIYQFQFNKGAILIHHGQKVNILELIGLEDALMHSVSVRYEIGQLFDPRGTALDRDVDESELDQGLTVPKSLEYIRELVAYFDGIESKCS